MKNTATQDRDLRCQLVLLLLVLLIGIAVVLNINTGSIAISPLRIFEIIFLRLGQGSAEYGIIWNIRLPRLLAAAVLGGSLAVSGFLLQTFFRNPIAGPFVLGISSGAKMFVSFTLIFLMRHTWQVTVGVTVAAAFLGSLFATAFVLLFAQKVRNMSMLLVVGIMIGYICSAITDFFITFAKEADIVNLTNWSMGSFSGLRWNDFGIAAPLVALGLIAAFLMSKPIGAYQLGEGYAQSVGINIRLFRVLLITVSSLLSAIVTAFAGPISFVGIAVPHITRMALQSAKPFYVIPGSFLCGAVFCLFCDLIARTAFAPTELAIGTVTSAFGAPVVIWLMLARQKKV